MNREKYDTLMSCFTLFLSGKETRAHRVKLRKRMMNHLHHLIFNGDGLSETCFTHAPVRALINRLHAINPEEIPKSAEILYIRDEQRFRREANTFITQNRREGFIGDMFTFCYLFAEMFKVDVHLFRPEEVVLSAVAFAKYNIHIQYEESRFSLIPIQSTVVLPSYEPPLGIVRQPSRIIMGQYQIATLKKSLEPPRILEYRVHYQCIYDVGLHFIEPMHNKNWKSILKSNEYAYIWGNAIDGGKLKILSCVSNKGHANPRFYVDSVPFEIYLIVEKCLEDAERAIYIEQR